jgi:phospho-N-acetylmuramoyl-pentapeptide-transferase
MILIFILALVLSLIVGKVFLKILMNKNIVQPILEDAPDVHKLKAGTPTMGGVTFLVPFIILTILSLWYFESVSERLTIIGFLTIALGYGYIGFMDDFQKVVHKKNEKGLSPKVKLLFQFLISFMIIIILLLLETDTSVLLFGYSLELGFVYYLIVPIMIVGFSNASNFTDGLDGLLGSVSVVVFSTTAIIAYMQRNELILIISFILIGALFGFLRYNKNPAKMFMGDTGSLVIGSLFAFIVVILKLGLVGLLIGFIYIFEVISVVIQVGYFKYTKKKTGVGRRVFKMAPFHHHFEQAGIGEKKIVVMFTVTQFIISIVAILIYIR